MELVTIGVVRHAGQNDRTKMSERRFPWQEKMQVAVPSDLVIRSALPQWIIRVLRQNGVKKMSFVAQLSDEQLLEIPGIGHRSVTLIRKELSRLEKTRREAPTSH